MDQTPMSDGPSQKEPVSKKRLSRITTPDKKKRAAEVSALSVNPYPQSECPRLLNMQIVEKILGDAENELLKSKLADDMLCA